MLLYILNRNEEIIHVLNDDALTSGSHFFGGVTVEKLSQGTELRFNIDMTESLSESVKEENFVVMEDVQGRKHLFIIKELIDLHGSEFTKEVICQYASLELNDDVVLEDITGNLFCYEVLTHVLKNTRWQVGNYPKIPQNQFTESIRLKTALAGVYSIAKFYGLEVIFRVEMVGNSITGRFVDFVHPAQAPDYGKRFEYSKDIESIKRTVNANDIKTALICYGAEKKEEGTASDKKDRISIEGIEWSKAKGNPTDKPKGIIWVEDKDATELWGYKNPNGTKRARYAVIVMDKIESPEELLKAGWEQLQTMVKPKVTYEINAVDLYALTGDETLSFETVKVGDMVTIIDHEFKPALTLKARVIEVERDLHSPENTKVILGNYIETIVDKDFKTQLNDVQIDMSKIANSVPDLSSIIADIEGVKNKLGTGIWDKVKDINQQLFEGAVGFHYMDEGNGIWVYDKPADQQPTKAVVLKGGQVGLARYDKQLQKWIVGTFIDGDSVNASMINTGHLKGDLIEAGTIKVEALHQSVKEVIESKADTKLVETQFKAVSGEISAKVSESEVKLTEQLKGQVDQVKADVTKKLSEFKVDTNGIEGLVAQKVVENLGVPVDTRPPETLTLKDLVYTFKKQGVNLLINPEFKTTKTPYVPVGYLIPSWSGWGVNNRPDAPLPTILGITDFTVPNELNFKPFGMPVIDYATMIQVVDTQAEGYTVTFEFKCTDQRLIDLKDFDVCTFYMQTRILSASGTSFESAYVPVTSTTPFKASVALNTHPDKHTIKQVNEWYSAQITIPKSEWQKYSGQIINPNIRFSFYNTGGISYRKAMVTKGLKAVPYVYDPSEYISANQDVTFTNPAYLAWKPPSPFTDINTKITNLSTQVKVTAESLTSVSKKTEESVQSLDGKIVSTAKELESKIVQSSTGLVSTVSEKIMENWGVEKPTPPPETITVYEDVVKYKASKNLLVNPNLNFSVENGVNKYSNWNPNPEMYDNKTKFTVSMQGTPTTSTPREISFPNFGGGKHYLEATKMEFDPNADGYTISLEVRADDIRLTQDPLRSIPLASVQVCYKMTVGNTVYDMGIIAGNTTAEFLNNVAGLKIPANTSTWYKVVYTVKKDRWVGNAGLNQNPFLTFSLFNLGGLSVRNVQVEKGITATTPIDLVGSTVEVTKVPKQIHNPDFDTWKPPSPFEAVKTELRSEIKQVSSEITAKVSKGDLESQVRILSDRIESKVSDAELQTKVELIAGQITSSVSKGNIISTINQSAEAIKIQASKINLVGAVTADSIQSKTLDAITIRGGTISGGTISGTNFLGYGITSFQGGLNVGRDILAEGQIGARQNIVTSGGQLYAANEQKAITSKNLGSNGQYIIDTMYQINGSKKYIQVNGYHGSWGVDAWVSDERLKMNIKPTTEASALSKIMQIQHKDFVYRAGLHPVQCGYIAQELQIIEPQWIGSTTEIAENGEKVELLRPTHPTLIPYITKGMQEMFEYIKTLEARIAELEKNQK